MKIIRNSLKIEKKDQIPPPPKIRVGMVSQKRHYVALCYISVAIFLAEFNPSLFSLNIFSLKTTRVP